MAFLWHDIRDGWRALLNSRGYSAVVALTLGLGIGVNTAIFSIVDALILKPLPYPEADRLVRVAEWPRTGGNFTVSPAAYVRWRDEVTSFSHFEARVSTPLVLLDGDAPSEVRGAAVTAGYFDLLGVRAAAGRTFMAGDDRPDQPCTIVVTDRFRGRHLAGDGREPGGAVRFSGRTCNLLGVLPPLPAFDSGPFDVFIPLSFTAADPQNHGRFLTVLARLGPGATLEQARQEMVTRAQALNQERGEVGRGWTVALTPLRDVVVRADTRWLALVLFGSVILVLLVACLNVAGLSLARTVVRQREIAIRTALGASRWRLFRYLVLESVMLAMAGGFVGLLLGSWVLRGFTLLAPPGTLPVEAAVALDARALVFTGIVAVATGLLFGTVPALRGLSVGPAAALAGSGRGSGPSRAATRAHSLLLVIEVALAMVLVAAAATLVVSFLRLTRVDPGFIAHDVLTMRLTPPPARYGSGDDVARFFDDALEVFRRVPGVVHAGAVTSLPLDGWLYGTTFSVLGEPMDADGRPSAHIQRITDGYFEALGIPLVDGRAFTRQDTRSTPRVAVVNDTFVARYVPDGRAVGRHLTLGTPKPGAPPAPVEIVGVIRDVKTGGLDDTDLATPEIYVPQPQSPMRTMFVAVRASPERAPRLAGDLMAALRVVDPEVPAGAIMTMDERIGRSVRGERFRTAMIGASASLALLLSCLGVYAIRSQAVAARIREIGIRLALGATPREVWSMVMKQGMTQVVLGVLLGLAGAAWAARLIEPWLFATHGADPAIAAAAVACFLAVALLASWFPARRAASVEPLTLLRDE